MSSSTSICRLLPSHWDMALPIGRIWFVCLAMILVSCGEREEERSILPDDFALCAGDVVFRRGEGITSCASLPLMRMATIPTLASLSTTPSEG